MKTYYFDLHVFYSRTNGHSVFVKMEFQDTPTEEQVIKFAIENDYIDKEDWLYVDYVAEITYSHYCECMNIIED